MPGLWCCLFVWRLLNQCFQGAQNVDERQSKMFQFSCGRYGNSCPAPFPLRFSDREFGTLQMNLPRSLAARSDHVLATVVANET